MNFNLLELFKKINLSSIASNTNKTLGIVKKSIPVYKQVRPYVTREKTIFKTKEANIIKERPLTHERSSSYNDTLTFFH